LDMNRRIYGTGLLVALVTVCLYAYLVPLGTTRLDYEANRAGYDPFADSRVDCGDDHFERTTSMWRLPIGMRDVLGGAEMSSPGGPFNPGDVGDGPTRRFAMAAIGQTHILAAVEQGGVGYSVEVWAFKRDGSFHWVGNRVPGVIGGDPKMSLSQLLALTCKH